MRYSLAILAVGLFAGSVDADAPLVDVVKTSSGRKYDVSVAKLGKTVYTDRKYTLTKLPKALVGKPLVRTANEDDGVSNAKHLRLTLRAEATLYLCFDGRADKPASWLVGWQLTNGFAKTTDTNFRIYRRVFPKGDVVLGGNERATTGSMSNYFVVVAGGKHSDDLKQLDVVDPKDIDTPRVGKAELGLPLVPEGFHVSLFAKEPLIRNPAALCFDSRGRLFVGQGPQYRNPDPDTPGDSVLILVDSDGDGVADRTKTFATGFNSIQGLAWRGNELWIANSPDLTVVRDKDGDDEADVYIRLYSDLGNLEHALHGLNWGPDGKLYMSRGNSKGYDKDGHHAPQAFRELSGEKPKKGVPEFPTPKVFDKGKYQRTYHHPADYWGRDGGVLRCDKDGKNLEIVSRGFRNPWDITFDDEFVFLGTDNDQDEGDRLFMPFFGSHFGWGHPWSYHWTGEGHLPTVPLSGPVFHGSGTGIVYSSMRSLPREYRGVFFVNDWLRNKTFVYRPKWRGALLTESDGKLEEFATRGKDCLFKPTDIVTGPDGALYVAGWGKDYGAKWAVIDGKRQQINEGRVFRIWYGDRPKLTARKAPVGKSASVEDLVADLGADSFPARRTDAQDELVRRGEAVVGQLEKLLDSGSLDKSQETWLAWAVGRIGPKSNNIDNYFAKKIVDPKSSQNLRLQALRILGHRARWFGRDRLPDSVIRALRDGEPRIRFEAVQAIGQAAQKVHLPSVLDLAAAETDRVTFYSAWQTLGRLTSIAERKKLLADDKRGGVRFAALLSLLHTRSLGTEEAFTLAEKDADPRVREWSLHYSINAIPAEVTSTRQDFSKYRLQFFGRVLGRLEKTKDAKVRRSLLALLGRLDAKGKNWDKLRKFYSTMQADPEVKSSELAYVLRALATDPQSASLLWDALGGAAVLRAEAVDGFSNLPDSAKSMRYLVDRLAKADDPKRLGPAIEALAKLDTESTWPPSTSMVELLSSRYAKSDDPRQRRWILLVASRVDFAKVRANPTWRKAFVTMAKSAAVDPDPRVHTLVGPLSTGLGERIDVTAKREPVSVDAALSLLPKANAARGRALFFDAKRGNCLACHRIDGVGESLAPPLSDIGLRAKPREIAEAILTPSAKITEGYKVTTIVTKAGKPVVGVVRKETAGYVELFGQDGRRVELAKSDIDERELTNVSIMPANFGQLFAAEEVADLVAWLAEQKRGVVNRH